MHSKHLTAVSLLSLATTALLMPGTIAAAQNRAVSSSKTHVLKGRLDTWTAGKSAILDAKSHDRHVALNAHTKVVFSSSVHHEHVLSRGDHVQVKVAKSGGVEIAKEIDDEGNASGDSEDFKGAYVASTDTTLTIQSREEDTCSNTQTFSVDANTQYFDQNGTQVPSLQYNSGEELRVEAAQQPDGSWLASSVAVKENHDGGEGDGARRQDHGGHHGDRCDNQGGEGSQEFSAAYSSNTDTTLTLLDCNNNSITFTVGANTRYFDANENQVSGLTYSSGEQLKVEAVQQSDGSWLAGSVQVSDDQQGGGGDGAGRGQNHKGDDC